MAPPGEYITAMLSATQSKWTPAAMPSLGGKVALVTGANSGLGYYTALHLGKAGAGVVITTRSDEKGVQALDSLRADAPDGRFEHIAMDLADLESVRVAAAQFISAHDELHVMVNNAGLMAPPRGETAQGFELQFGVNHLGHFALTALLKEIILGTARSRVVNVASGAAHFGRMRWDDLQWTRSYRRYGAYGQSKLANVLFTMELNRRLQSNGHGSLAAMAHPGLAATNLQRNTVAYTQSALERIIYGLLMPRAQSAMQGSWPQLRAATDPAVEGGEFFGPHRPNRGFPVPVRMPKRATSEDAARLWAVSEELTGIDFTL